MLTDWLQSYNSELFGCELRQPSMSWVVRLYIVMWVVRLNVVRLVMRFPSLGRNCSLFFAHEQVALVSVVNEVVVDGLAA